MNRYYIDISHDHIAKVDAWLDNLLPNSKRKIQVILGRNGRIVSLTDDELLMLKLAYTTDVHTEIVKSHST